MINRQLYDSIGKEAEALKDYPNEYNPEDPENKDKLIRKNMRIPVDIAMRLCLKYSIVDEELEDVIGQGLLGLAVAYDKYKPEKNFNGKQAKFSSVAYFWARAAILNEVKNIIDKRNRFVDIEESFQDKNEYQDFYETVFKDTGDTDLMIFEMRYGLNGDKPMTMKEISKQTGFSIAAIKRAIENARDVMKRNCIENGLVKLDQ